MWTLEVYTYKIVWIILTKGNCCRNLEMNTQGLGILFFGFMTGLLSRILCNRSWSCSRTGSWSGSDPGTRLRLRRRLLDDLQRGWVTGQGDSLMTGIRRAAGVRARSAVPQWCFSTSYSGCELPVASIVHRLIFRVVRKYCTSSPVESHRLFRYHRPPLRSQYN